MTAYDSASMDTAGPTLVIAHSTRAARALAAYMVAEHAVDPAKVYPLAVGAAPHSRPYAAAVMVLPPHGLSADDVDWIEASVLARLAPGAELVVRFSPREGHATRTVLADPAAELDQLRLAVRVNYGLYRSAHEDAVQAEAAIARVRELHSDDHGLCAGCTNAIGVPSPCATIRALNGETT